MQMCLQILTKYKKFKILNSFYAEANVLRLLRFLKYSAFGIVLHMIFVYPSMCISPPHQKKGLDN